MHTQEGRVNSSLNTNALEPGTALEQQNAICEFLIDMLQSLQATTQSVLSDIEKREKKEVKDKLAEMESELKVSERDIWRCGHLVT